MSKVPFTGAIEILATIPSWWLASFFYATLMGRCDVYGIPVIVTLLIPLIWIVRIRVPTHADPLLGFAGLGTCLLLFIQLINPMPEAIGAGWWAIACSCLPWLAMAMYGAHQSESIIRGLGWSLALLVCVSLMGQALTSGITYRQASWWGVGNINV